MNLLVLGGTLFVGRHLVEAATERGFRVTTFTRGRTNPDLFPSVESLHGDRDHDLARLRGRTWNAVVDTSAYLPRQALATSTLLSGAVGCYVLVSTASVYREFPVGGATEETPTWGSDREDDSAPAAETYGARKAGCERAVSSVFGGPHLIVRPGLLVGPHDPTGRFDYWIRRVAAGGEVLAPGEPRRAVQLLDARDLASWILDAIEGGAGGVVNASGPARALDMGDMLETCRRVVPGESVFTWTSDDFLLAEGVTPWTDLPLWLPTQAAGQLQMDNRKAIAAGLRFRPLVQTVADVYATPSAPPRPDAGGPPRPVALSRERESDLLRRWHARAGVSLSNPMPE